MTEGHHYWVGEGSKFSCSNCKSTLNINIDLFAGKSYVYTYPNGDTSTVFGDAPSGRATKGGAIKDICPVDWDPGEWLPGAVEIPLHSTKIIGGLPMANYRLMYKDKFFEPVCIFSAGSKNALKKFAKKDAEENKRKLGQYSYEIISTGRLFMPEELFDV